MTRTIRFIFALVVLLSVVASPAAAQDELLFRKHVINSGWNGLFYGIALDYVAGIDGAAAAGLPVITAGTSAIIPLLTNSSKTVTANSLMLSGHGRMIGWAHGAMFSTLIQGEKAWEEEGGKITAAAGALTSIGLGRLGYSLGKSKDWSEGQVALYRHYGWIIPFTGFSVAAVASEDLRLTAASTLLFGAGSYYLADQVFKANPHTRGDVRAIKVLSGLHGLAAWGFVADKNERTGLSETEKTDALIPAVGLLAGTALGHFWMQNTFLTNQQGTWTAYAATGGALIGLGVALITESDKITPYYIIPYLTGMGAFAFAVERFRRQNESGTYFEYDKDRKMNWDLAFMPQSVFLNNMLISRGNMNTARSFALQPAFTASLRF